MKVAFFSARPFEQTFFEHANANRHHELVLLEAGLNLKTAPLANGFPAVCAFVNDQIDREVLEHLAEGGTRLVALRCAGFNNVDVEAAESLKITVARVPAYSPHSVAEHTVALILALNRKLHRSFSRVRDQNFSLDGLLGFDLNAKTVGIVGTGKIGAVLARIMRGFGCRVLGSDPIENSECVALGMEYVDSATLARESDIISLHCPLTPATHHIISASFIQAAKSGVMLINTSRGALIDTSAVIGGLKSGRIGALGLDVYEEEADLFFRDLSGKIIQDDIFARLLTFPNVIVTAHQAFFTQEALGEIANVTLQNVSDFEAGAVRPENLVTSRLIKASS